ncbi:hypothetical protein VNI00_007239 [Paramarasmius palmivorus]|uniref:F-box domain-containing protein n=1 Tax=Paramarasmius palmivorus TaxID=297713 RepID=A0AAW0D2I2_9AGAR
MQSTPLTFANVKAIIRSGRLPLAPAEIAHLNNLIETVRRQITELKTKRGVLKPERTIRMLERKLESYSSIFAPIRRVPPEILTAIFIYAVDTNCIGSLDAYRDATAAMSLGMVCSVWRTVALSTPTIWASLLVRVEFLEDLEYPPGVLQRLKLHLIRSQGEHLDVTLIIDEPTEIQTVIDYVGTSASDSIRIPSYKDTFSQHRRYIGAQSGPGSPHFRPFSWKNLQSVELLVEFDSDFPQETSDFVELFGNPSLRYFRCSSGRFPLGTAFPKSQITHLRIDDTSQMGCLLYLSYLPALVTARFTVSRDEDEEVPKSSHLVLLQLRSLSLDICSEYWNVEADVISTSVIHDALTLPSLKNLAYTTTATKNVSIYDSDSGLSTFMTSLSTMHRRSKCTLSSFKLDGIPAKDADLVALLDQMPHLVELDIREARKPSPFQIQHQSLQGDYDHNVTITSELLQSLTFPRYKSLSQLRRIVLWIHDDWKDNQFPFELLLESRSRLNQSHEIQCIESAYLHIVDGNQEAKWLLDWKRLRRLQKAGMAVKVVQHFDQNNLHRDEGWAKKVLFGYK